MKALAMLLALASFSSFANDLESVFKTNSKLPRALQEKVLSALVSQADCIADYTLEELSTIEKNGEFKSDFVFSYYFDGQHRMRSGTTVLSSTEYVDVGEASEICQ